MKLERIHIAGDKKLTLHAPLLEWDVVDLQTSLPGHMFGHPVKFGSYSLNVWIANFNINVHYISYRPTATTSRAHTCYIKLNKM